MATLLINIWFQRPQLRVVDPSMINIYLLLVHIYPAWKSGMVQPVTCSTILKFRCGTEDENLQSNHMCLTLPQCISSITKLCKIIFITKLRRFHIGSWNGYYEIKVDEKSFSARCFWANNNISLYEYTYFLDI